MMLLLPVVRYSSGLLSSFSAFASGLVLGVSYVRWGLFYSRVDIRFSLTAVTIGCVLWQVVYQLFMIVPAAVQMVLAMLLPVASCLMLGVAHGRPPKTAQPARFRQPMGFLGMWKAWCVIVAAGIVTSMLLASTDPFSSLEACSYGPYLRTAMVVVLYGAVLAWALRTHWAFSFAALWRIELIFAATGLACSLLAPGTSSCVFLAGISWNVLIPFVWFTAGDIARHSAMGPHLPIAICLSAYSLPFFFGSRLYELLSSRMPAVNIFVVTFLVLFIVLALCLETRDPDTRRIFEDLRGRMPSPDAFADIDARCLELGEAHGLTVREIEVARLLCRGMSRTYIAESLFISENTVKAHVGHIYAKLGVHSRAEVQELVGA